MAQHHQSFCNRANLRLSVEANFLGFFTGYMILQDSEKLSGSGWIFLKILARDRLHSLLNARVALWINFIPLKGFLFFHFVHVTYRLYNQTEGVAVG